MVQHIKSKTMFAAVLLLAVAALGVGQTVKAWDGGFNHFGWIHHWSGPVGGDCCNSPGPVSCCGDGGFYAGQQDAQYDHINGYSYNPIGQCLPCHSQDYWNNFHQGYDEQWGSYQSQKSNQGTSININGNNNYVSTTQVNNQQQSPIQQLAHTVCGFINCAQAQQGLDQ